MTARAVPSDAGSSAVADCSAMGAAPGRIRMSAQNLGLPANVSAKPVVPGNAPPLPDAPSAAHGHRAAVLFAQVRR